MNLKIKNSQELVKSSKTLDEWDKNVTYILEIIFNLFI
jgi:hypothetical protein